MPNKLLRWVATAGLALGIHGSDAASADPAIGPSPGTDSNKTAATPQDKAAPTVELSKSQLDMIRIEPAGLHRFEIEASMVGILDIDEDRQTQVFTPYQGRIIAMFAQVGDTVHKGQTLFTIDSAELLQAEATLIQTAGVADLTKGALARAKRLVPAGGGAQKDLDQAISDQQTAEGNFRSAYDALFIYGKDDADIARILHDRKPESTLVVKSPIDGLVTARSGSAGLFVQPGTAPAPLTVADTKVKWLNASAGEADVRSLHVGDRVEAHVFGMPDMVFRSRVSVLGETIDAATRRLTVRSDLDDPTNALKPGMFANVTIATASPRSVLAIPPSGVVREGDGTMVVWVTQDRQRFTQRVVRIGIQQDGYDEILEGLQPGELVVTDGAIFVSNILDAGPSN